MSLRVADIRDLELAKQVATLALPENERPYARLDVGRYLQHMPLERQVRSMRREGLDIDSATLWEQTERLACVLEPTAEAIRACVIAGRRQKELRWT
ncbi:MAG: hypothetical protein JWN04_3976 [Myxococcaceae bacterium]|nr:hypothetical protein [Myxococcaceae bacterium]